MTDEQIQALADEAVRRWRAEGGEDRMLAPHIARAIREALEAAEGEGAG